MSMNYKPRFLAGSFRTSNLILYLIRSRRGSLKWKLAGGAG
jgi:hypothetical protein